MKIDFKNLFVKPTVEDKSCYYTFQRIYKLAPRHYIITNCSDGFINLMKKGNIRCTILTNTKVIETEGRGSTEIEFGNNNFASFLFELKGDK